MPHTPEDIELLRHEKYRLALIEHQGFGMSALYRLDEVSRLDAYITVMEKFLESSILAELDSLEPTLAKLTDIEKDVFLQDNYPVHWEDNFGTRIRSAFCIQLCSYVEDVLVDLSTRIHVIGRCSAIKLRKHLPAIGQYESYFADNAEFSAPAPQLWELVGFVALIRNAFVHNNGVSNKIGERPAFDAFLAQLPNVAVHGNFIELQSGSCTALLRIVQNFLESLRAEFKIYQARMRAREPVSFAPGIA